MTMAWVAAGTAAAGVVGGMVSANAAKGAAATQAAAGTAASQASLQATRESNAMQQGFFNQGQANQARSYRVDNLRMQHYWVEWD